MPPGFFEVFMGFAALWSAARVVKAANALRTEQPYVFSQWDGGVLRRGRTLTPGGTRISLALNTLTALGAAAWALHHLPGVGMLAILAIAVADMVVGFALVTPKA